MSGHTACAPAAARSARPTCPPPMINSAPNHPARPSSVPAATPDTAGRRPAGTEAPRLQAKAGHAASAVKAAAAAKMCGSELPPPARTGFTATKTMATPPVIKSNRPAAAAGRSASPVMTWHAPVPNRASVITHRSAAPTAASALMVPVT
jgi:hypothetical protein